MDALITGRSGVAERFESHDRLDIGIANLATPFHRCPMATTDPPEDWHKVGAPQKL